MYEAQKKYTKKNKEEIREYMKEYMRKKREKNSILNIARWNILGRDINEYAIFTKWDFKYIKKINNEL